MVAEQLRPADPRGVDGANAQQRRASVVRFVFDDGRVNEAQLADELARVAVQVRESLERELRDAGQDLMRALDEQINHIDELLWELVIDQNHRHDDRVLRDAREAASALRDHAGVLPDRLESFVKWSQFDQIRALSVDVRHGLT